MLSRSKTDVDATVRRRFLSNAALVALLSIHVVLVGWGASLHSPNLMEAVDLPAGLSHLEFANFELRKVNPPLVRTIAAIPVAAVGAERDWRALSDAPGARPEFAIGRDFIDANGIRSFWLFTLARWSCLPFTVLGGIICHRWARALYGEWSAVLAAALWCFDPNILGHAQTMNADVPAAAMGLAACHVFWMWMKRPTGILAATAGAMLGMAWLTRTTLMVLAPTWGLIWFLRALREKFREAHFPQLLLIFGLAIYTLNLGYGFDGSLRRLRDFGFVSHCLGGDDAGPQSPGNRFRESLLGAVPVPLPQSFVEGIDVQRRDFENSDGRFRSYLRGTWSAGGWWYYYLYGLAVKLPEGTWVLVVLSLAARLASWRSRGPFSEIDLLPLVAAAAILVLVSSQTGFSIHFRYVLPMFSFAFVWISRVAEAGRYWRIAGLAALALSIAGSLWVWPHSLSYFNELAGGPRNGHAHLLHSSIDWGQDLLFLRDWIDQHPESRGMQLAYSGPTPARLIGVESGSPPHLSRREDGTLDPESGPQPGWQAVSVNYLRENHYSYFLDFKPVAMAGYSIYIYRLDKEEVKAWRRRFGVEASSTETNSARSKPLSG